MNLSSHDGPGSPSNFYNVVNFHKGKRKRVALTHFHMSPNVLLLNPKCIYPVFIYYEPLGMVKADNPHELHPYKVLLVDTDLTVAGTKQDTIDTVMKEGRSRQGDYVLTTLMPYIKQLGENPHTYDHVELFLHMTAWAIRVHPFEYGLYFNWLISWWKNGPQKSEVNEALRFGMGEALNWLTTHNDPQLVAAYVQADVHLPSLCEWKYDTPTNRYKVKLNPGVEGVLKMRVLTYQVDTSSTYTALNRLLSLLGFEPESPFYATADNGWHLAIARSNIHVRYSIVLIKCSLTRGMLIGGVRQEGILHVINREGAKASGDPFHPHQQDSFNIMYPIKTHLVDNDYIAQARIRLTDLWDEDIHISPGDTPTTLQLGFY